MNGKYLAGLSLAGIVFITGACGGGSDPLPQGSGSSFGETTEATEPTEDASTCDVVREAFLTGDEADIEAALTALQADTGADATAREHAKTYLEAEGDSFQSQAEQRDFYESLITSYCAF